MNSFVNFFLHSRDAPWALWGRTPIQYDWIGFIFSHLTVLLLLGWLYNHVQAFSFALVDLQHDMKQLQPLIYRRGEIGFRYDIHLFSGVVSVIASGNLTNQFPPGWYYFGHKTKTDISQAWSTHQNQRVGRKVKETANILPAAECLGTVAKVQRLIFSILNNSLEIHPINTKPLLMCSWTNTTTGAPTTLYFLECVVCFKETHNPLFFRKNFKKKFKGIAYVIIAYSLANSYSRLAFCNRLFL